jgi:hypothetical protein
MNQTDSFLQWFQEKGGELTLWEILSTRHSAEYRKEISLLRQRGYRIEVTLNRKIPSLNLYKLTKIDNIVFDKHGQGEFING